MTKNYCNWDGKQTSPTLTSNNAGGGRECLTKRISIASSKSGCLNASMAKGKNGMDAFNDMLVVEICNGY